MLIAESDAKFKFCPLLKTHDDKMKMCLVTQCMMWRQVKSDSGEPMGWCGLAGRPDRVPDSGE